MIRMTFSMHDLAVGFRFGGYLGKFANPRKGGLPDVCARSSKQTKTAALGAAVW